MRRQYRGLAATRAADQRGDLAGMDRKIDIRQGFGAIGIGLAEMFDSQHYSRSLTVSCQRTSGAGQRHQDPVGSLAEQGEGDDGGDDLVGQAHLLTIDEPDSRAPPRHP